MPERVNPVKSSMIEQSNWRGKLKESAHVFTEISNILETLESGSKSGSQAQKSIWLNPGLHEHRATANLDNQPPATLFYLGLVKDIPQVVRVYVEELERGRRKHWTVLSERDYDAMEEIYDIEETTLDRFPNANIDFRVTVLTHEGPSTSPRSTLIYDVT